MKTHLVALACAGLLAACGGGGSVEYPSSNDAIDRYIGTWVKKCDTWSPDDVSDLNGRGVSAVEAFKFDKVSATKASYVYTLKVYANADNQCTGQPIATVIKSGLNNASVNISSATATMISGVGTNELTHLGTQALSTETVDKVQFKESKLTDFNGDITVGGAIIKKDAVLSTDVSTEMLAKFKSTSQILLNDLQSGVIPSAMKEDEYWLLTKQ
jgi:hypothetical protein